MIGVVLRRIYKMAAALFSLGDMRKPYAMTPMLHPPPNADEAQKGKALRDWIDENKALTKYLNERN